MAIEVDINGSGEIGDIIPGWSVQEYATPIIPGSTAGGTGLVSFSAAAKPDSLFIVNNNVTTTEESLGSVTGVVKSVSQTGGIISATHGTPLAIFDANFDIPALGAGGMLPVIDIASQLSGRDKLCIPTTGYLYTMCGHSAGFDYEGNIAKASYIKGSYQAYNNGTGQFYPVYYSQQYGSIWADSFAVQAGEVYATNVYGDAFSNSRSLNVSRLAFKARLSSPLSWNFVASPDDSNTGSGQEITLSVSSAGLLELSGRYRSGGSIQDFFQTSNLAATFDVSQELTFFIEYRRPASGSSYTVSVQVCGNGSYLTPVTVSQTFVADNSYYIQPWLITGMVRDIYGDRGYNLSAWVPAEYSGVPSYIYSSTIELDGPVPAQVETNLWNYMQDACAVYEKEVVAIDGAVVVREIDTIDLNVDNHTPITITPSIVLSGRNVEIDYSNGRHVSGEEIYSAYKDENRVISVKASETVKTVFTISGTVVSISLPTYSSSPVSGPGEYKIVDSKGNPIPINLWNANGGRLDVNLVEGQPNAIEVTFIGPTSTDGTFNSVTGDSTKPLYPGPYKLAYTADGTDYAALSIIGTGIITSPQTLKLRTAADPEKTAQDVAKTITNQFIITKGQAYDRGLLAAIDASGPTVTITGTVSVNDVAGFGMTAGSRVRYMDSIYRVTDVSYSSMAVNFTATRHVKVSDFDSFWDGKTVGLHDSLWSGYDGSDHAIKPLWFVGDDEALVMLIDTDGNPYYAFVGTPEISVLFDTDGVPYVFDGDIESAYPVYLDVDGIPYVQG